MGTCGWVGVENNGHPYKMAALAIRVDSSLPHGSRGGGGLSESVKGAYSIMVSPGNDVIMLGMLLKMLWFGTKLNKIASKL